MLAPPHSAHGKRVPLKTIMHNSRGHLMGLAVWKGAKSDGPLQFHGLFSGKRMCKWSLRKQQNHYWLMLWESNRGETADQSSSSDYSETVRAPDNWEMQMPQGLQKLSLELGLSIRDPGETICMRLC